MDIERKVMYKNNVTAGWDGTVSGFAWGNTSDKIFFNAPVKGTEQLFEVRVPANENMKVAPEVRQITYGNFDVNGVTGQASNGLVIVTRCDMNHAGEIYSVNPVNAAMLPITHANDDAYAKIRKSKTELRMVKTTDGRQMGVWVVYPPDFDPAKSTQPSSTARVAHKARSLNSILSAGIFSLWLPMATSSLRPTGAACRAGAPNGMQPSQKTGAASR